jgi:hypothetical protein
LQKQKYKTSAVNIICSFNIFQAMRSIGYEQPPSKPLCGFGRRRIACDGGIASFGFIASFLHSFPFARKRHSFPPQKSLSFLRYKQNLIT